MSTHTLNNKTFSCCPNHVSCADSSLFIVKAGGKRISKKQEIGILERHTKKTGLEKTRQETASFLFLRHLEFQITLLPEVRGVAVSQGKPRLPRHWLTRVRGSRWGGVGWDGVGDGGQDRRGKQWGEVTTLWRLSLPNLLLSADSLTACY